MPHIIMKSFQAILSDQVHTSVKHAYDNILISSSLFLDGNRLIEWIFEMDISVKR